jgi:hypothetical protein
MNLLSIVAGFVLGMAVAFLLVKIALGAVGPKF